MSLTAKKYLYLVVSLVFYTILGLGLSFIVIEEEILKGILIVALGAGIHLAVTMEIVSSLVNNALDIILAHPVGKLPADDPIWKALERRKEQKERDKETEYIGT